MKYLFKKILLSSIPFALTAFLTFAICSFIESFIETRRIEELIAISNQIDRLEEAIILLQKKEIERLEKDLEECKDNYRENL